MVGTPIFTICSLRLVLYEIGRLQAAPASLHNLKKGRKKNHVGQKKSLKKNNRRWTSKKKNKNKESECHVTSYHLFKSTKEAEE